MHKKLSPFGVKIIGYYFNILHQISHVSANIITERVPPVGFNVNKKLFIM